MWQPQLKKHNFQHSTRSMLWQLRRACNNCLVSLFLFYKETRQIIHLGERNSILLATDIQSNIKMPHVLAPLHLHAHALFVHNSTFILTRCVYIKLAKQLSQLYVTCRIRFNHCQEQLLKFQYRKDMTIRMISSSSHIQL